MKKANQIGFSIIEVLLILIVVSILGFTGWYVYHAKQASNKNYSAAASLSAPAYKKKAATAVTTTTNAYVGWKTFCSSKTSACFKYDPSWTFAECAPVQVNEQGNFQNCPSSETVSLIAPDKVTRVDWYLDPYVATDTGPCTQGSSQHGSTYSDITAVPNTSNLYFVNIKNNGSSSYDYVGFLALTTGYNGQQPTVGQPSSVCPSDSFLSKDGKYKITFDYSYDVNASPNLPASDQNPPPSQTDLSSVKQTLLSFYYK